MTSDDIGDTGLRSHVGANREAIGERGADEIAENLVAGCIAESPVKAAWNPGCPGFLSRRLMALAGVDPFLASMMPANEQQGMARVGIAVVFGITFQAICFGTALATAFGPQQWTIPVTLVLCGVMYAYDSKFVATDWTQQGLAFCRSRGIIPEGGWQERMKRPSAILIRWVMSLFIASTLATFVLLILFDGDIKRQLAMVNRRQNASVMTEVISRYDALVVDLAQNILHSDTRLKELMHQYTQAREPNSAVTDIDRQIGHTLERINGLEALKANAERSASEHRRDVQAEKYGIRLSGGTTGVAGHGNHYEFYAYLAAEQQAIARARASEIEIARKGIAELRAQRASLLGAADDQGRMQLEAVQHQIAEETVQRAQLRADFRKLQDRREQWIEAQVRESPSYVSTADGILAKLEGLAALIAGSNLIAGLALSTKLLIMLLESAGPVAKVFFTSVGIYQMSIVLRVEDEAEMEVDRRLKWERWRLIMRSRNHRAMDEIIAARRRRETSNRAREALDQIIEKLSRVH
jgi:hypothetical protein